MGIMATQSVATPARTLDQWWVAQLTLRVGPSGKLAVHYVMARGDDAGPSTDPAHRQPFRVIDDLAALFAGDPAALALISQAQANILGLVQKDMQNRGVL